MKYSSIHITGDEIDYIRQVVESGKTSGNGPFTKACQDFFSEKYGFAKCLLTTSCTDALEMAAILTRVAPGDEVIMPSFTFVSTANPFLLRGAKIVFADSMYDHPNICLKELESLITSRTKVIVPVHYAGVACDMDTIMSLANLHGLWVVEDAAQAIDAYYKGRPLGSIGHLGAMSFHETKNITAGEGGALFINDSLFDARAEIIWEKGTNRSAFFRGEVDKYGWVDIGSSFLPSEMIAAFLYAQLMHMKEIQKVRGSLWNHYYDQLLPLDLQGFFQINRIPDYARHNSHIFYIVTHDEFTCDMLLSHLKKHGIPALFHYQQLHSAPHHLKNYPGKYLPNADRFTHCLVRLPLHNGMTIGDVSRVCESIRLFFHSKRREVKMPLFSNNKKVG